MKANVTVTIPLDEYVNLFDLKPGELGITHAGDVFFRTYSVGTCLTAPDKTYPLVDSSNPIRVRRLRKGESITLEGQE